MACSNQVQTEVVIIPYLKSSVWRIQRIARFCGLKVRCSSKNGWYWVNSYIGLLWIVIARV